MNFTKEHKVFWFGLGVIIYMYLKNNETRKEAYAKPARKLQNFERYKHVTSRFNVTPDLHFIGFLSQQSVNILVPKHFVGEPFWETF